MESERQRGTACCALCAAALGLATCSAASATPDGGAGPVSTASVQIRLSIAQRGGLLGLQTLQGRSEPAFGDPFCLWLNTGTGRYSLTTKSEGAATHLLSWSVGGRSVTLGPDASPTLQAATRPRCNADQEARIAFRRVSSLTGSQALTLLVAPE